MAIVNAQEFADFVGKSAAWVSKQIAAGMPVARYGENGLAHEIDSVAAINWLLDAGGAAAKLKRAQAEKAERENLEAAGKLVSVDAMRDFAIALCNEFLRLLGALPGRMAGELAAVTSPALVRARLIGEINGIRNTLAEACARFGERFAGVKSGFDVGIEDAAGTEVDNSGSVGGRESDTSEGLGGAGEVPVEPGTVVDRDHAGGGQSEGAADLGG